MQVRLIYLAAGNSRRFGENKLFYEIEGKPMFRHVLERLLRIVGRHDNYEIVVVSQYERLLKEAGELGASEKAYSPQSREGISHSIRAGIQAEICGNPLPDAYVFFVADQPFLTEKTAESFLSAMEERDASLGCVAAGRAESHPDIRLGNPVWFSSVYRKELLELDGDQGGKKVLRAHREKTELFFVKDEEELRDMDRKT